MRRRSPAAWVAVATATLVLALVGVACGGGDDDVPAATTGSAPGVIAGASTTSAAPDDPSASTTTVAEGPTTTSRASTATTPVPATAPPATAPPATTAPAPPSLTPAAPGRYRYATTGGATFNGTPAPFPPVTDSVVDPPAGTRQRATRNLRDTSGNGSVIEYTFDYRADGVYLVSIKFTTSFSGFTDVRDLTPPAPLLFLATGAAQGASRTLDIPLSSGGAARVVVDVVGTEPVAVAGQSIDTLVVRFSATLPPGQVTGTQTLTVNLDKGSRLWLRERGVGDATAGGLLTVHTEYTATLQSLIPG